MKKYKDFGANEVLFNYQGADADRYHNVADITVARHGAIFVGHCEEEDYVQTELIEDVDPHLQIHGNGWIKRTKNIVNLGKKYAPKESGLMNILRPLPRLRLG